MANATTAMFDAEAASYSRRQLLPCFDAFYGSAVRALELAEPGPLRTVLDLGTADAPGVMAPHRPSDRGLESRHERLHDSAT